MYSTFQLAKKYLHYLVSSKNGRGHGIHSPFVFDFVIHVLNDRVVYECYDQIESIRKQLLGNNRIIEMEDFGAGSAVIPFKKRKVNAIARSSLKNAKFARLLFRMVHYYQPETIIELGTSLGITTGYLSSGNQNAQLFTFEGSGEIANIARQTFNKLNLQNVQLIEGNFDKTFLPVPDIIGKIDFAFVDGNHRKNPTMDYFRVLLEKRSQNAIFIFDDIHWSAEMEAAWKEIQEHVLVTLTIDLFFVGIVFFNPDFKVKQHFTIRF